MGSLCAMLLRIAGMLEDSGSAGSGSEAAEQSIILNGMFGQVRAMLRQRTFPGPMFTRDRGEAVVAYSRLRAAVM